MNPQAVQHDMDGSPGLESQTTEQIKIYTAGIFLLWGMLYRPVSGGSERTGLVNVALNPLLFTSAPIDFDSFAAQDYRHTLRVPTVITKWAAYGTEFNTDSATHPNVAAALSLKFHDSSSAKVDCRVIQWRPDEPVASNIPIQSITLIGSQAQDSIIPQPDTSNSWFIGTMDLTDPRIADHKKS